MFRVVFGKQIVATRPRPLDAEGRIVKLESALGLLVVEVVSLVAEERVVLKDHEPVRKAPRNVELAPVLGRQLAANGLPVGRRTLANVDRHIEDPPASEARAEHRAKSNSRYPARTARRSPP